MGLSSLATKTKFLLLGIFLLLSRHSILGFKFSSFVIKYQKLERSFEGEKNCASESFLFAKESSCSNLKPFTATLGKSLVFNAALAMSLVTVEPTLAGEIANNAKKEGNVNGQYSAIVSEYKRTSISSDLKTPKKQSTTIRAAGDKKYTSKRIVESSRSMKQSKIASDSPPQTQSTKPLSSVSSASTSAVKSSEVLQKSEITKKSPNSFKVAPNPYSTNTALIKTTKYEDAKKQSDLKIQVKSKSTTLTSKSVVVASQKRPATQLKPKQKVVEFERAKKRQKDAALKAKKDSAKKEKKRILDNKKKNKAAAKAAKQKLAENKKKKEATARAAKQKKKRAEKNRSGN